MGEVFAGMLDGAWRARCRATRVDVAPGPAPGDSAGMLRMLLLAVLAWWSTPAWADTAHADFHQRQDPPLVKKFAVMNSGLVEQPRYARDLAALRLLGAESLRVDLFIGHEHHAGWNQSIISGTSPQRLTYAWEDIDLLTQRLDALDTLPYWSFCYVPAGLQSVPGDWRSPPGDLAAWSRAAEAFARHFRERKLLVGYHEAYNEPDFTMFWHGSRDQYFDLYRASVRGFRRGNPDAVVGGPALAFTTAWIAPLLDAVAAEDLPMDFFSFHAIEGPADAPPTRDVASDRLRLIAAAMGDRPGFATTEIHLNEYHPYRKNATGAFAAPIDGPELAVRLLDDFAFFLGHPELTLVHWAQFMDAGRGNGEFGLLGYDGVARPAYAAFACYADLPVERFALELPAPLAGFAAADRRRAGVLLWNPSAAGRTVALKLDGLPFTGGRIHRYPITGGALPISGFPEQAELAAQGPEEACPGTAATLALEVPAHGVLYVRIEDPAALPAAGLPGRLVRTHTLYASRSGGQYAVIDRRTATFHLGQGAAAVPVATGVTLDDAPASLQISGSIGAGLPPAAVLGLRIDYLEGEHGVSAVWVRGPLAHGLPHAPPWGTHRMAERTVVVGDLAACTLPIASWAPPGWHQRMVISAVMQDGGPSAHADLTVHAGP